MNAFTTVIQIRNKRDDDVTFDLESDDPSECLVVRFDRDTWEEMGSPDEITATLALAAVSGVSHNPCDALFPMGVNSRCVLTRGHDGDHSLIHPAEA